MASVTFTHYYQLLRVEENNRLSMKSTGTIQRFDLLKHSKSTDYLKFGKPNQTLKESYLYKPYKISYLECRAVTQESTTPSSALK